MSLSVLTLVLLIFRKKVVKWQCQVQFAYQEQYSSLPTVNDLLRITITRLSQNLILISISYLRFQHMYSFGHV